MAETPPPHPAPLPPPRGMTLAIYNAQSQRTRAYLSLHAQKRAGVTLNWQREMTDALLGHLTEDDLRPGMIEWPSVKRRVEWPVVLLTAIALFTVAGLVLNLRGCFR